jgi:hypothetical protein
MVRKGWRNESARHSLAARGVRTGWYLRSRTPAKASLQDKPRRMSKDDFIKGYIESEYPGLTHYIYQGEPISPEYAEKIMWNIMYKVDRIELDEHGNPILILGNGVVLYTESSDDWPSPSTEDIDGYVDIDGEWVNVHDDDYEGDEE